MAWRSALYDEPFSSWPQVIADGIEHRAGEREIRNQTGRQRFCAGRIDRLKGGGQPGQVPGVARQEQQQTAMRLRPSSVYHSLSYTQI